MERVRARFPHTLVLQLRARRALPVAAALLRRAGPRAATDLDVCCDFLEHVRGGRRRQRARSGPCCAEAVEGSRQGRAVREDEGQADTAGSRAGRRAAA